MPVIVAGLTAQFPMISVSSRTKKTGSITFEVVLVIAVLLLSIHFHARDIRHRVLPGGDEGSWMAVASQLEAGEGFSTRWLEHPFLKGS